jgi:hypothetical protein
MVSKINIPHQKKIVTTYKEEGMDQSKKRDMAPRDRGGKGDLLLLLSCGRSILQACCRSALFATHTKVYM